MQFEFGLLWILLTGGAHVKLESSAFPKLRRKYTVCICFIECPA